MIAGILKQRTGKKHMPQIELTVKYICKSCGDVVSVDSKIVAGKAIKFDSEIYQRAGLCKRCASV